jgi:ribosome biogenesis GTPase A
MGKKRINNKSVLTNEFSLLKLAHATLSYNFPKDKLKEAYSTVLYEHMKRIEVPSCLYVEFAKILFSGKAPEDMSDENIINSISYIKKKYRISKSIFSSRISYKYFLMLELAYIIKLCGMSYETPQVTDLCKNLSITINERQILEGYINLFEADKVAELYSFFNDTKLRKIATTINPLTIFINNEYNYYNLPRRNISVFSTMSAGKSTFINALLGHDYLPSKNEACTAKIASIADIDYIDYCLGYAVKNGKYIFCGNVDQNKIQEWNNDGEVSEIALEGNLDKISGETSVTVIHDTPGINYSGNNEHKKITLKHLVDSKPEIIICLLDATQMFTTDFSEALEDLKKANNESGKARVFFVINKADSYDAKKESLGSMVADTANHLDKCGFENFVMVPVSARAARLFKMALHGRTEFTEDETDDFSHYIKFFQRPENDLNLLATGLATKQTNNKDYAVSGDSEIVIAEKSFNQTSIINAHVYTGIPFIENVLNTNKGDMK